MKAKLKSLSSRRHVQSVIPALYKIKVYMRGWLNYYGFVSNTVAVKMGLTKEILIRKGFYYLADAYQQMHVNY